MDIDISNPPDFETAPVEVYSNVLPDEEDFQVDAYDIGVVEPVKVSEVPLPAKTRKTYKPRAKVEPVDNAEFIPTLMEIPERLAGTVIGRLAKLMHERIEFPEMSSFFSLLATASCSVATNYATQYSTGSPVALGLYVIVEHPPATMKSYLLDVGLIPYRHAVIKHNKKVLARNIEIAERGNESITPLKKTFTETSDGTTASIDGFLVNCQEGRFVVSSAEQSCLKSLFPETGSFSSNNELLLKGYAGEFISGMRATRKAFTGMAQGAVAVIAQPGSSQRVLTASDGSGLAERFMYLSEPDTIGFRRNEGVFPTRAEKSAFQDACMKCVEEYSAKVLAGTHLGEDERIVMDPENLVRLRASDEGYRILHDAKNSTESLLYDLKNSGEMVMMGWLGKIITHALKIAGNIHVIECLANNCKVSEVIPTWIIEESIDLVLILSEHIKDIMNSAGESGSQAEEETIIDILSKDALPLRGLILKAKNRKPFKAMPAGFKIAGARVEAMIRSGILRVNVAGKIEVV